MIVVEFGKLDQRRLEVSRGNRKNDLKGSSVGTLEFLDVGSLFDLIVLVIWKMIFVG